MTGVQTCALPISRANRRCLKPRAVFNAKNRTVGKAAPWKCASRSLSAQIINASFSAKVVAGEDDKIIKKMSAQEEESQVLTPGLREVMDINTNRPNWGKKLKEVDCSKAIKVGEYFY